MELYLLQHGHATTSEENAEQPLTTDGVAQMQAAGQALKRLGIRPDLILCSPKKRSHQSAALIAEAINYPHSDITESELVNPLAPPAETLRLLRRHHDSHAVLIAGHLPSLAEVASYLLGNGSRVRIHFENGGLCRLDVPEGENSLAQLRFALTAAQVKLIAD